MTKIGLGQVLPLDAEIEAIAAELLQGLQYSFVAAAAHPAIRLPFGGLEEAFQDAITLRPAEQRWVYHSRARRVAMLPAPGRQALFGRFGHLPAEEFAHVGLATAFRHLAADGAPRRRGLALVPDDAPPPPSPVQPPERKRTLALYITEVSCLDRLAEEAGGEEIALGGLAIDASGGMAKVGRFLVREDFEDGVRKAYGFPGRKFCEFELPEQLGDEPAVYGAATFLEVADRAGFSEALAGAWAKASPILSEAVQARIAGARAATISRTAGNVVERFVRWLGQEFNDDIIPPGLAFAGLHAGIAARARAEGREVAGEPGQLTFAGRRGRYLIGGQWRVRLA